MESIKKIFDHFIDVFLPRSTEAKRLQGLSPDEFLREVRRSDRGNEENIMTLFNYKDPLVKEAIWQIKYRNNRKVGHLLAEIIYVEIVDEIATLSQFANFTSPILIPIPLSKARLEARGYNQSENLAKEIAEIDGSHSFKVNADLLVKTKETPPQSSLTRTLRLKNLKGCFSVKDPEKLCGRNVILIDDVMTTGATLREARSVLVKVGVKKVIAIAIAH